MKVHSLALALRKLPCSSNLGKMVSASAPAVKQNNNHKKLSVYSKKSIYEKNIKDTFKNGVANLYPCSLLTWKPGTPMKTCGATGRIKWGLSDGKLEFVVVIFDSPQTPGISNFTSDISIVSVSSLTSCDCGGYTHKKNCSPKKC